PDTMFRIASMTKALTSVAALQLIERDRLALDTKVESLIPAFAELRVLDGWDGETPRLRMPARPVTVRDLMTHTSGHGYFFTSDELTRYHAATGTPSVLTGELAALRTPLLFDPGARWEYGISTDWLGQVVEMVAGQDLGSYFAEHITGPLGMTDTTFAPSDEQRARLMPVHHRMPDGGLVAGELELAEDPEFFSGGGGLYATGRDYARFMAALLDDGGPLLRADTVALAFTDHVEATPLPEVIKSAAPEIINDVPAPPWPTGFGLGFQLNLVDLPGMRRAGTGSWSGLFNSYFWIDRASGIAGALLTQVLPFFDDGVVETALGLEQAVYAKVGAPA
ncbi:MAG TPA: serine hydrolase domain-containing protein, partial [Casimicrobiaceae bacterium]